MEDGFKQYFGGVSDLLLLMSPFLALNHFKYTFDDLSVGQC